MALFAQLHASRVHNVLGMDDDMGFGIMRVTRDEQWKPAPPGSAAAKHLAGSDIRMGHRPARPALGARARHGRHHKIRRVEGDEGQDRTPIAKDYLLFPALSGRRWRRTLTANVSANLIRNLWAYVVIFCGHFPDGAEKFEPDVVDNESKPEWYLRQMLGSANFDAGRVLAFLSGNLCYQIEHHLFPDLPSNRLAQIAHEVRALCDKYDLPYTTGPLPRQYLLTLRTIHKLALPDRFLTATSDDAPETASERKFSASATPGPAAVSSVRIAHCVAERRRRPLLTSGV